MALLVTPIKQPPGTAFSGNDLPYLFAFSPYGTLEKSQDIRLQVRILVEQVYGSGTFSEIRSQVFLPDDAGNIAFSVHSLIDPYLNYFAPRLSLAGPTQASQQRKRYKIAYTAYRDGVILNSDETAVKIAVKGGMSYGSGNLFSTPEIAYPLHPVTSKRKVFAGDPFFFWWTPNLAAQPNLQLKYRIDLNDGTTVSFNATAPFAASLWSIWVAPAGFLQAGLDGHVPAGKIAVGYAVIIANAVGGTVLCSLEFELEQRNFYETSTLLYRNSCGGLETIRLRGQVEFEADYTQQQAQRTLGLSSFGSGILQAQTVHSSTEETPKYKGDTGFISKETADGLRDFFLSPERWELRDGKQIPIELQAKNTKFWINNDSLFAIQIEWNHAFVNEFYTVASIAAAADCPALELLIVKQINKNTLQVQWAMPEPYDKLQLQVIVGTATTDSFLSGNAGNVKVSFSNPSSLTSITVKGRVVCDDLSSPASLGPFSTVVLAITGNSLVVAVDDYYTISSGYTTPVLLAGSVLANDYDPDGDPIAVIAASGTTHEGGTFSIDAAGNVSYTPPSGSFSGEDYFDYQVRETPAGTPVTARVHITVGSAPTIIYVKKVLRNEIANPDDWFGEVWFDFFSNAACTIPADVTGLGLVINFNEVYDHYNPDFGTYDPTVVSPLTVNGAGTSVKAWEGFFYQNYSSGEFYTYSIVPQPGSGYVIV